MTTVMRWGLVAGIGLGPTLVAAQPGVDASGDGAPSKPSVAEPAAEAGDGATVVEEGPVVVTARVRPDPSHIGDILELEVVAGYPKDVRVNLPSVLDFSPLHLVSVDESEPEATGVGLRKTFTIELQCFEVGEASTPPFSLTYVTADGQVRTVEVPARSFVVESLLANENDPQRKPEDPPISIEYPNTLAETIVYSAAATLAGALLLWILGRRLWGREKIVPAPPPIPPHELALEALRELEDGELIDKGRWPEYYLQLTEIAKGYLEGRFGVEALDRTTEEIRRELLRDPARLEPLSVDEVVAFLHGCDLVKFARFRPNPDEALDALTEVRTIVERTMARPRSAEDESRAAKGGEASGSRSENESADSRAAARTVSDGDREDEEARSREVSP